MTILLTDIVFIVGALLLYVRSNVRGTATEPSIPISNENFALLVFCLDILLPYIQRLSLEDLSLVLEWQSRGLPT